MTTIHGFTPIKERAVPEEASTLHLYKHEKTGARVLHMKNTDDNKVFAIAFPTPPLGSTGNCHILEHCVLNGSRKYRTKEPFMDLLQSSLQTFLNAMTYPDKTVYPIASRNPADFHNLMDLYLDAVFYPAVLEDERIFRQEGWHYAIDRPEDPLTLSGVVYSEMRGAMSSPEDQVFDAIMRSLYRGTIYANNAGGDPYRIPDLTYEAFCDFHRTYYHPSNAYIFLYGAIDEEATFDHLASYLDAFDKKDVPGLPDTVARVDGPITKEIPFSIDSGEDEEGQAFFSLSWLVDRARTDEVRYLYHLMDQVLVKSESSSLRRAILEEVGAKDLLSEVWDLREVGFSLVAKGVNPDKKDLFLEVVDREIRRMVEEGLDRDLLAGLLQSLEFDLREKQGMATKGILFMAMALSEGIYGADPMDRIAYADKLRSVRAMVREGALEAYIREKLLDNPNRVFLVHLPKAGLNAQRDRDLTNSLADYKAGLSGEEIQTLIQANKDLADRQNRPDSPEAKATIPRLGREDLPDHLVRIPREVRESDRATYLLHDLPTSGITYLTLVFDLAHFAEADLPYVTLVSDLMGRLSTRTLSYREYEVQEDLLTGGITLTPKVYDRQGSMDFQAKLLLSTKFLGLENLSAGLDLMADQVLRTRFDETDRIREVMAIILSSMEMGMVDDGSGVALQRAMAQVTPAGAYNDRLKGLSYYLWLKDLARNFGPEDLVKFEEIYHRLFLTARPLVNITGSGKDLDRVVDEVEGFLASLPVKSEPAQDFLFLPEKKALAFSLTSDVQFVAMASLMDPDRAAYGGHFQVLSNIMSNTYLYTEIRAKGGAYGQGLALGTNQVAGAFSYRDPQLRRTLDIFRTLPDRVAELDLTDDDLFRFIIGSVGRVDGPMTENQKGLFDLSNYLRGVDRSFHDRILREIKETRLDDLRAMADPLKQAWSQASVVVLGSKEAIDKEKDLFDEVRRI